MIKDLRIGQKIKFDKGIGEIVQLSDPNYQDYNCNDNHCIIVKHNGAYYSCTIKEIQEFNHLNYGIYIIGSHNR